MSEERRRHPRVPFRVPVEVGFTNWDVFRLIYTINISQGGMSIQLPREPVRGMRLAVKLLLPDGVPITLDGAVRHVAPLRVAEGEPPRWQVGVEFQELDAEKRAQLERIVALHGPLPSRK